MKLYNSSKTIQLVFSLLLLLFVFKVNSSTITVGSSCVVNNINNYCSTNLNVQNTEGLKVCLWRKATNGKPLKIFSCHAASNLSWSKIWTETSVIPDDFELKSHLNWPTMDPQGLSHAYNLGILITTKEVVAEYGKISIQAPCTLSNNSGICPTEIFVNKKGGKRVCLWRKATHGKTLKLFACHAAANLSWSKIWTKTSTIPDDFVLLAHDSWPTQDSQGLSHAYGQGLLLDSKIIIADTSTPTQPPSSATTLSSPSGAITDTTPTFSWSSVSTATGYKLNVKNTATNSNVINTMISGTSYTPTTALPVGNYSWTVTAYNSDGDGPVSTAKSFNITSVQPLFMGKVVQGIQGQDIEANEFLVNATGDTLTLTGNTWKAIDYSYDVTANTVLQFDFRSAGQEPEINGIGFTNSLSHTPLQNRGWQVHGTQNWSEGITHANYSGSNWVSYSIPIGQTFTGHVNYMVFVGDDDVGVNQSTQYYNPRLIEGVSNGQITGSIKDINNEYILGSACIEGSNIPLEVKLYSTFAFSEECKSINGNDVCLIASTVIDSNTTNCETRIKSKSSNNFSIVTPSIIKNGGEHKLFAQVGSTNLIGNPIYSFYSTGISPYWDSGLSAKCIKRSLGNPITGFQDVSGCTNPNENYYTLGLQAEQNFGDRCEVPGDDYGASITNQGSGPFQFYWTGSTSELTANLVTDINTYPHSCGEDGNNVWNWFVFSLRASESGVNFPRADKAGIHFTSKFNYSLLENNANTRLLVACEGWWDGKGRSAVVNLLRTNYVDNVPNDPEVVTHYSDNNVNYIGEQLGFGVMPIGVEKNYFINCGSMFKHAVKNGYLPEPSNGWAHTQLSKVWIGHELHNISNHNSGTSKLELKNYRVIEIN